MVQGLGNVRNWESWIKAQNLPPGLGLWASPSLPQGKERKPPAVSAEVRGLERSMPETSMMTGGLSSEPEGTLTTLEGPGPPVLCIHFPTWKTSVQPCQMISRASPHDDA